VPILGIITCLILMFSLPEENWWRLIIWLGIGLVIYFIYGRKHSVLAELRATEARGKGEPKG
jgi:APA family basic amino acid/polyamine antiporter